MERKVTAAVILLSVTAFILAGCHTSTASAGFGRKTEVSKVEEQTYPMGKSGFITIENKLGNVRVQKWNGDEVKVETTRILRDFKAKEELEGQLADLALEVVPGEENFKVQAAYIGPGHSIDGRIDLKIFVPAKVDRVEATLSLGNLWIGDLPRVRLDADVNMGNVELSTLTGKAGIRVNMGNIRLSTVKLLDKTELFTNMGNIEGKIELQEKGNYKLEVKMGNVDLKLPGDTKAVISGKNKFNINEFEPHTAGANVRIDCDMGKVFIRKL